MDIQSLLTLTIVAIFWAFVSLVMFQFINGLFVSAAYTSNVVSVSNGNIAASTIPSVSEVITPQARTFEKLPDPWTLEDEAVHHTSNEAARFELGIAVSCAKEYEKTWHSIIWIQSNSRTKTRVREQLNHLAFDCYTHFLKAVDYLNQYADLMDEQGNQPLKW